MCRSLNSSALPALAVGWVSHELSTGRTGRHPCGGKRALHGLGARRKILCFTGGHLKRISCSQNIISLPLEIANIYVTYTVAVSLVPPGKKAKNVQTYRDPWKLWEGLLQQVHPSA